MCDGWFSRIELPISFEEFDRLPRNAAYKYEYFGGRAVLTPRPKYHRAVLELGPTATPDVVAAWEKVSIRRLRSEDCAELPEVFSGAFWRVEPFANLDKDARLEAARKCLERTRSGAHGPLVEQASYVACNEEGSRQLGAMLITLRPEVDLTSWEDMDWPEPPPPDCVERRLGRPAVTWVFVSPWHVGHGVGTALLAAAVREVLRLGYRELASGFLVGNDSSMLWHWRNGFRLLAQPGSWRLMRQKLDEESNERSCVTAKVGDADSMFFDLETNDT